MTTGLKEAILEFFSWESLGAGSAGLRCRAGGAPGRLCQAGGAQFCCNTAATRVNHGAILNQIVGGVQCRESLHSRYLSL